MMWQVQEIVAVLLLSFAAFVYDCNKTHC